MDTLFDTKKEIKKQLTKPTTETIAQFIDKKKDDKKITVNYPKITKTKNKNTYHIQTPFFDASGDCIMVDLIKEHNSYLLTDDNQSEFKRGALAFDDIVTKKAKNKFNQGIKNASKYYGVTKAKDKDDYYIKLTTLSNLQKAYFKLVGFQFYYRQVMDFVMDMFSKTN